MHSVGHNVKLCGLQARTYKIKPHQNLTESTNIRTNTLTAEQLHFQTCGVANPASLMDGSLMDGRYY